MKVEFTDKGISFKTLDVMTDMASHHPKPWGVAGKPNDQGYVYVFDGNKKVIGAVTPEIAAWLIVSCEMLMGEEGA